MSQTREIFKCTKCGECCKGYGGTYVSTADIQAIAAYIHLAPEQVLERYCCMSGTKTVLAQGDSGYCIFWDDLCTIHPVKPRMCRQWPYIESVLMDSANWRIMAGSCPGMRTDVADGVIRETVRRKLGF